MPILIFDGDCGFCRKWIAWLKNKTGDKLRYAPYQEVAEQYPQIPRTAFVEAIQLIDEKGQISSAAKAFFIALQIGGCGFGYWCYQKIPGFSFVSELFYKLVARHRTFFSYFTK